MRNKQAPNSPGLLVRGLWPSCRKNKGKEKTIKSFLYDDEKTENLLPTMRKIDTFLKAEGFALADAGKTIGGYGCTVNRCYFVRGRENVFVIINRPKEQGDKP
jgi:hypothetical protein